jgi:glycosyltransferase involved in cell wall biosynthesis
MSAPNSGAKLALKRLEVALLHRYKPDLFVFESEAMRRLAVDGRGVPASRTIVVHTGVDAGHFRLLPEFANVAYRRFDTPANRRIVVYMGHLHEGKGCGYCYELSRTRCTALVAAMYTRYCSAVGQGKARHSIRRSRASVTS